MTRRRLRSKHRFARTDCIRCRLRLQAGSYRVLAASDVSARGIHGDGISDAVVPRPTGAVQLSFPGRPRCTS
jgi:hypothetical protein